MENQQESSILGHETEEMFSNVQQKDKAPTDDVHNKIKQENPKDVTFNDFQSVCRTCLSNNNLKPIQDNVLIEVLQNIADINVKNDELPQQLCENCMKKIHDIHTFILKCKTVDLTLKQCLFDHKNNKTYTVTETSVAETTPTKVSYTPSGKLRKIHACNTCNKTFTKSSYLMLHKRVHTGEAPYKCDECAKAFKQSSALTKHKRVHNGDRPYKCDTCPSTFTRSSNLKRHKVIHSELRPNKCDVCFRIFTQNSDLIRHKVVHDGLHPHQCATCNEYFARLSDLRVHERVHSGERPYACDVCEMAFAQSCALAVHKRLHAGVFNDL